MKARPEPGPAGSRGGKAKAPDPRRLDVGALARAGERIEGRWPLASFERLQDALHPERRAAGDGEVAWSASGEQKTPRGAEPQPWLHLQAEAVLGLECQRCLGPVETLVRVDRAFRFVRDEATAEEEDPDSDEDLLVLGRWLDLQVLLEDELLLALPLVPRHERCPDPPPMSAGEADLEKDAEKPNPFAALAQLKGGKPGR